MKKQEFKKNEESLRRLWDISKCANIQIIGFPEGKKRKNKTKTFKK